MIWIIASLPFWIAGILFLIPLTVDLVRSRGRCALDGGVVMQMTLMTIFAGVFFLIAAKVAS